MSLRYTYGVGLAASACAAVNGWEMTDALPVTLFSPQTAISVAVVDDAGATITGDAISSVVLYGDLVTEAGDESNVPIPALLPGFLPGEASEAA
jgi:hypothetical protein